MDYSPHALLYHHRQDEFHQLAAGGARERLGTYRITSPCSYRQRYPVVDSHMVGGFEDYRPKPRWSSHYQYWAQMPLSPNYSGHHQERSWHRIYHPTHGERPWAAPGTEHSGYISQPAYWRSRAQYHPRPRSARFWSSNPYVPEHRAPDYWTNAYGRGRRVEPDLEVLPRMQTTMFDTSTMPGDQRDRHHGANLYQEANEGFMSQQNSMTPADLRPGLAPGHYRSRWSYSRHSPEHTHTERRSCHGDLDPAFNSGAETTGQECGHRNYGISDENHGTTGSKQQRPYRRSSSTRLNRNFATKNASYGLHNVPITSTENIAFRQRPTQQPNRWSDRANKSYPEILLGPSNTTATPSLPGNPTSPYERSKFGSFYVGDSFQQRRRRSESSDDTDTKEGCYATQYSRYQEDPTHPSLPPRTSLTSKDIRQELHRCAQAAAALQLERTQLRKEWKQLRREQETLLYSQRRLRHDWQNWKDKQHQHPHRHNDAESMDRRNDTASSTDSDPAEPPPPQPHHRPTTASYAESSRPSPAPHQTNPNPALLLAQYNHQWTTLPPTTSPPWPTPDLHASTLHLPNPHTPRILLHSANKQDLPKWNAFTFFTSAFGTRATLTPTATGIAMNIDTSTMSVEVAKAMRDQAREDVKRWHQDKLAGRDGALVGDEGAKAVFAAVLELYAVCGERVRAG